MTLASPYEPTPEPQIATEGPEAGKIAFASLEVPGTDWADACADRRAAPGALPGDRRGAGRARRRRLRRVRGARVRGARPGLRHRDPRRGVRVRPRHGAAHRRGAGRDHRRLDDRHDPVEHLPDARLRDLPRRDDRPRRRHRLRAVHRHPLPGEPPPRPHAGGGDRDRHRHGRPGRHLRGPHRGHLVPRDDRHGHLVHLGPRDQLRGGGAADRGRVAHAPARPARLRRRPRRGQPLARRDRHRLRRARAGRLRPAHRRADASASRWPLLVLLFGFFLKPLEAGGAEAQSPSPCARPTPTGGAAWCSTTRGPAAIVGTVHPRAARRCRCSACGWASPTRASSTRTPPPARPTSCSSTASARATTARSSSWPRSTRRPTPRCSSRSPPTSRPTRASPSSPPPCPTR